MTQSPDIITQCKNLVWKKPGLHWLNDLSLGQVNISKHVSILSEKRGIVMYYAKSVLAAETVDKVSAFCH